MKTLTLNVCVSVFLLSVCNSQVIVGPSSILSSFPIDLNSLEEIDSDESAFETDHSNDLENMPDATCNVTVFEKCSVALTKELNITSPIHSAADFVKALQKIIWKEGQNGFKRLCKSYTKYKKCLGKSYSPCINVDFITKRGIKRRDAYIYVTIVKQFVYECSPSPYKTILDNWDCINSTEREAAPHFKKCMIDFVKNIKKHPRKACPLAQKLVTCVDFPFGRKCNKSVVSVVCNTMKISFGVSMPKCNISCPNATMDTDEESLTESEDNLDIESLPQDTQELQQQDQAKSISVVYQSPFSIDALSKLADGTYQSCDEKKFKKAIVRFVQVFGLEKLPSSAVEFVKAIRDLYKTEGNFGFKKSCEAGKQLYNHLGKDQYNLCVSKRNLESLGYSPTDVLTYMVIASTLFYDCGEGYEVYFANFDCITSTGKQKLEELKTCYINFQTNVTKDPIHVCDFAQNLLSCFQKPYEETCGRNVGRVMCMTAKAEIGQVSPECKSLSCVEDDHSETDNSDVITNFGDRYNNNEDF